MTSKLADFVISIHDGHIVSQGSVREVLADDETLVEELKHDEEAVELDQNEDAESGAPDESDAAPTKPKEGKLVVAEEVAVGHVSWKACASSIFILLGSLF